MAVTTKVNPGSVSAYPKMTLRKMLSKSYARLKKKDWSAISNGLIADTTNLFNQRKSSPNFYCNLCESSQPYFANISNRLRIKWHSCCPQCNSRPRHRGLKELYLEILPELDKPSIIHFAPEPVFYPIIDQFETDYKTTDYFLEDVTYPKEDIQSLTFENDCFDMALCNHVIEHVPDDNKAVSEVYRVLKPGGIAIFTIPGNWYKEENHIFKDLNFNGHYRDYGLNVVSMFKQHFGQVDTKDLHCYNNLYELPLGIRKKADLAFICKKV